MTIDDNLETANAPAEGKWEFDTAVAESFDRMLERSIPSYEDMRKFTTEAAVWTCQKFGGRGYPPLVVDLGASRGSALDPIIERMGDKARYFAAEISEPMLSVLRDRYTPLVAAKQMVIQHHDLREGYPSQAGLATVIMSILTLQFVPIEYRQRILREASESLRSGGILILVEKTMAAGAELEELFNEVYWGFKMTKGQYTQAAIDRKRLSLEGVLVPLTARFNEELVLQNGFATCDLGWCWGPFKGYVAVKR